MITHIFLHNMCNYFFILLRLFFFAHRFYFCFCFPFYRDPDHAKRWTCARAVCMNYLHKLSVVVVDKRVIFDWNTHHGARLLDGVGVHSLVETENNNTFCVVQVWWCDSMFGQVRNKRIFYIHQNRKHR